jgi:LysM repeat protein
VPRRHGLKTTTAAKARTTTAKARSAGRRFWTVQAGDTFGVISSKSGVPVKTIVRLNPKVTSTSLHIGERIRLR